VKIIKDGVIPTEWPYEEWECDHCHCVFQPEVGDAIDIEETENRCQGDATHFARLECPQCERLQVKYGSRW